MKRNQDGLKADEIKKIIRRPNGTKQVLTINNQPSRTQQHFKDECDVNNIVAKFRATGSVTHLRNSQSGVYADLTQLPIDLMEARQVVIQAEAAFEQIPAQIRQRFGHDPKNFIDFLADPANDDEAVKLGLKTRPKPEPKNPIVEQLEALNTALKPKKKQSSEE